MIDKKRVGAGFGVIVLDGNKVLMGLRNDDAVKADSDLRGEGTWCIPGGKLNYGETFEQGGIRETKEETDIDVHDIEVYCVQNDMNEHAHYMTIGMVAKKWSGTPKVTEPDEIVAWKWFDLDDLPKNIFFPSRKCIEKYCEGVFYKKGGA